MLSFYSWTKGSGYVSSLAYCGLLLFLCVNGGVDVVNLLLFILFLHEGVLLVKMLLPYVLMHMLLILLLLMLVWTRVRILRLDIMLIMRMYMRVRMCMTVRMGDVDGFVRVFFVSAVWHAGSTERTVARCPAPRRSSIPYPPRPPWVFMLP